MTYEIRFAYVSHIGKRRINNEDNLWCCGQTLPIDNAGTEGIISGTSYHENMPIFAVFDGMGGESCGEIAAGVAAQALEEYQRNHREMLEEDPEKFLYEISEYMNQKVCGYEEEQNISSMGSTSALLVMGKKHIYAGNLGDSRIYQMKSEKLERISTDHVLKAAFLKKAPLVQYLGMNEENMKLDPSIVKRDYRAGDRFLICSDGVTDMLTDDEISRILSEKKEPKESLRILLEASLNKGGHDNITMILCEISGGKEVFWRGKIQKWFKRKDDPNED